MSYQKKPSLTRDSLNLVQNIRPMRFSSTRAYTEISDLSTALRNSFKNLLQPVSFMNGQERL